MLAHAGHAAHAVEVGFPEYQAHPEVWLLVAGLVAGGAYVARVIGPKMAPTGAAPITPRQRGFFAAALAVLWLASDWPVHDIAEEYLYSVHMVQHLLLTFVFPPLLLLATPEWFARLLVGDGRTYRVLRRVARPIPAAILYNGAVVFTHWNVVVNASVGNGALHYAVHTFLVAISLLMWALVCGPLPELRLALPNQMGYLFLQSVIPTVPASWLTMADGIVYRVYDIPERLWGVSAQHDQQVAGLIMKIGGGFYLWGIITFVFFVWASRNEKAEKLGLDLDERQLLLWDDSSLPQPASLSPDIGP